MKDYDRSALHLRDCTCEDCVRGREGERAYREAQHQKRLAAGETPIACYKHTLAPGLVCQCHECQAAALSVRTPGTLAEPLPDVDYRHAEALIDEVCPSPLATMPVQCDVCRNRVGYVRATKGAKVVLFCEGCVREGRA